MKTMNSIEIRARIDEITQLQERHQKRNFDSELLDVMKAGGDIDALEQKQLEDERSARRLRVEKQALEAQLPEVVLSEAKAELETLKDSCKHDPKLIQEQVEVIEQAFNDTVKPALEALEEIRVKRYNASRRADVLTRTHKLNWNNPLHFGELGSRKLKLIQAHISIGRAPDAGSTVVTGGKFIEDL